MHCDKCGTNIPDHFKFCGNCGEPLRRPTSDPLLSRKGEQPYEFATGPSERRHLTVMFCDLVGSTALSEKLDPEDLHEVIRLYQETCTGIVHRFGGYIARYISDALLVYFGYPVAQEDAPRRAVRAGLAIVAALPNLNTRVRNAVAEMIDTPLQVRVGIHTGLVVVGEMGSRDYRESMALGETPNIAARLQALADPNTVIIGATTHKLVEGYFDCQHLGAPTLKGLSVPLRIYQAVQENDVQDRLDVNRRQGLTPFVGRENELQLLLEHWQQVKAGYGNIVLLNGEAGIGKSRLLQEFKECVAGDGPIRIEGRCTAAAQNSAFYPLITFFQRLLQFSRNEPPRAKLEKLENLLRHTDLPVDDTLPVFADLLSLPLPPTTATSPLTPAQQRQKTFEVLLSWLLAMNNQQPVILIGEDLHWVDPSTLELILLLIERAASARILLLLTFRPEFIAPWLDREHVTQIELGRLSSTDTMAMIDHVTKGRALPSEVLQELVSKTDGVPLFVEELTRMILESGFLREGIDAYELTQPLPPLAIPTTLQDSLRARLDRLVAVREVAQLGATLGREFSYELIHAVAPLPETTLQWYLTLLVDAGLLQQQDHPPHARYTFKHALVQETAYQSLLKGTRQQYHQQIAQILAERFPEIRNDEPELLAYHYTEAGLISEAIPYRQKAARRAAERSAHQEAISHLRKGLELLASFPETPARLQQELALHVALGGPLIATKGYGAPEVETTYARARDLCQRLGETPRLLQVLFGLEAFYFIRGQLRTSHELAEQCLNLATRTQDLARLLHAHSTLGMSSFHRGEFTHAREQVEAGITLYNPALHRSQTLQDPGVTCLSYAAMSLWVLGYPDQARIRSNEALALAQSLDHPFSLVWAHSFAAVLYWFLADIETTEEHARTSIALCREHGFIHYLAMGTMINGWTLTRRGQAEQGITQLRKGLSAYRAAGAELARSSYLATLADAYLQQQQPDDGLAVVTEALAAVQNTEERLMEADLYRLKGELTLQSSVQCLASSSSNTQQPTPRIQAEAEACFHKALTIARQQQAKSFELRAAMSLSRLWYAQGKQDVARDLLTTSYRWFTEGFTTADLQEAKSLLKQYGVNSI